MLLRYLSLFLVFACSNGQDLQDIIGQIFSESTTSNKTFESLACSGITGSLSSCHECYLCDEPTVKQHEANGNIIERIKLIDDSCGATQICCVAQNDLIYRTKKSCGFGNPDGYPRSLRPTARTVLQGEYPWRAWVFSKFGNSLICAATLYDYNSKILITSASCLEDEDADSIMVAFGTDPRKSIMLPVKNIITHNHFNRDTNENNIAIIRLKTGFTPQLKWVKAVCPALEAPLYASSTIAVSEDMIRIQTSIIKPESCLKEGLHPSLLCALAPPDDYHPQHGSGLFYLNEINDPPYHQYSMYGIALRIFDHNAGLYTNVSYFNDWIEEKS